MTRSAHRSRPAGSRFGPAVGVGLTLLVLGTMIFLAGHYFRQRFREQIVGRDAEIISALWFNLQESDPTDDSQGEIFDSPANQFAATLQISKMFKGVLATRLFDEKGNFTASVPEYVSEGELTKNDLLELNKMKPISRFYPAAELASLTPLAATVASNEKRPLLEISVPLHPQGQNRLLGVAQFVLEGESAAREFAALDRNLFRLGVAAFLASGSIVVIVLGFAF